MLAKVGQAKASTGKSAWQRVISKSSSKLLLLREETVLEHHFNNSMLRMDEWNELEELCRLISTRSHTSDQCASLDELIRMCSRKVKQLKPLENYFAYPGSEVCGWASLVWFARSVSWSSSSALLVVVRSLRTLKPSNSVVLLSHYSYIWCSQQQCGMFPCFFFFFWASCLFVDRRRVCSLVVVVFLFSFFGAIVFVGLLLDLYFAHC
jgi:hypothetical protein